MVNKKNNLKNLSDIRSAFKRKIYFEGKYQSHLERTSFVRMSAGAEKISFYGLFPPRTEIDILNDRSKYGKETDVEKNIDFKYYFDNKGKVIMIERFDPTSRYENKLINTIFVEYEKRRINIIFCKGKTDNVSTVAQCKLDLYNRVIRYMECTCGVNGYPYVYTVQNLYYKPHCVKISHSVYSIWQQGDETLMSNRKFLLKNGKLHQLEQ